MGAPPTAALRSLINSKLKLRMCIYEQEVIVIDAGNSARISLLLFWCVKSKYNSYKATPAVPSLTHKGHQLLQVAVTISRIIKKLLQLPMVYMENASLSAHTNQVCANQKPKPFTIKVKTVYFCVSCRSNFYFEVGCFPFTVCVTFLQVSLQLVD